MIVITEPQNLQFCLRLSHHTFSCFHTSEAKIDATKMQEWKSDHTKHRNDNLKQIRHRTWKPMVRTTDPADPMGSKGAPIDPQRPKGILLIPRKVFQEGIIGQLINSLIDY